MGEEGEDFTEVPPPRAHGEFTVICIGFVLDPQALLCPSPPAQSGSISSDGFGKSAPGDGNALGCPIIYQPSLRVLDCPLT